MTLRNLQAEWRAEEVRLRVASTREADEMVASNLMARADQARACADDLCLVDPDPVQHEVCLCAAVRLSNGFVVRGHRHNDCLRTAGEAPAYRDYLPGEQGFLTTRGRFVDRVEGLRLQLDARVPCSDPRGYLGELYSEDLY